MLHSLTRYCLPSIIFLALVCGNCTKVSPRISSSLIIDRGQISADMLNLFEKTKLAAPHSLEEAISETQAHWLRKPGTERWEMDRKFNFSAADQASVQASFTNLLMIQAVQPQKSEYAYVVILGATVKTMRARFAYFLEQWKNFGLRAPKVIFLVGQRPRAPEVESTDLLLGNYEHQLPLDTAWKAPFVLPKTETEMAKLIVEQSDLPEELTKNMITFVDTPLQKTKSGALVRPNTTDTVDYWLASTKSPAGSILAVSSNPYSGYQHAALVRVFPPDFSVETVGPAANNPGDFELLFDSAARWLYQYR